MHQEEKLHPPRSLLSPVARCLVESYRRHIHGRKRRLRPPVNGEKSVSAINVCIMIFFGNVASAEAHLALQPNLLFASGAVLLALCCTAL